MDAPGNFADRLMDGPKVQVKRLMDRRRWPTKRPPPEMPRGVSRLEAAAAMTLMDEEIRRNPSSMSPSMSPSMSGVPHGSRDGSRTDPVLPPDQGR